jgi:hypothetical protein
MDGMNGNKWATASSIHILLTSSFYHSTLHRLKKWRTGRNGGWLLRRPKLTLSCSAEGKEGIFILYLTFLDYKTETFSVYLKHNGNDYKTSRVSQLLFRLPVLDNLHVLWISVSRNSIMEEVKKWNTNAAFIGWQFAAFKLSCWHSCYELQLMYAGNWKFKFHHKT